MELGTPTEADIASLPFLKDGQIHYDRVDARLKAAGITDAIVVVCPLMYHQRLVPQIWFKWELNDEDRQLIAESGDVWVSLMGHIQPMSVAVGKVDLLFDPDAENGDPRFIEPEVPDA